MPEKLSQLGLKIPEGLYSQFKQEAKKQGKTTTNLLISILKQYLSNPSEFDSFKHIGKYAIIYDMGSYDVIIDQFRSESIAKLAIEQIQSYHDKPLKVVEMGAVRNISWEYEQVPTFGSIKMLDEYTAGKESFKNLYEINRR